jgi:DNA repair exonuclease SbcCD ATPase subunit
VSEYDRLNDLTGTCPTCLGESNNSHREARLDEIELQVKNVADDHQRLSDHVASLEEAVQAREYLTDAHLKALGDKVKNEKLMDKLESERLKLVTIRSERNFYAEQLAQMELEASPWRLRIEEATTKHGLLLESLTQATKEEQQLTIDISDLNWLYDKSFELRGQLLQQALVTINRRTNDILERFFDAELRVRFELNDGDKVDVLITNAGYDCPYRQLSGGERCLLKLAFNFAYMSAAENRAGTKFATLMLDESLNGLDASLKVKAFTLLQSLEELYETILVIDHSEELKILFENQYVVDKPSAHSTLTKA